MEGGNSKKMEKKVAGFPKHNLPLFPFCLLFSRFFPLFYRVLMVMVYGDGEEGEQAVRWIGGPYKWVSVTHPWISSMKRSGGETGVHT